MPPPKPKIPPEYANKASAEFTKALDELAGGLKNSLDKRTFGPTDIVEKGSMYDNQGTRDISSSLEEAGQFLMKDKTGKTPDVQNPSDFTVALDELFGQFNEPKQVLGSGKSTLYQGPSTQYTVQPIEGTGVLHVETPYTPEKVYPTVGYLYNEPAYDKTMDVARQNAVLTNDKRTLEELDVALGKGVYSNNINAEFGFNMVENMPVKLLTAGAVGAGALVATQAEASPISEKTKGQISLTRNPGGPFNNVRSDYRKESPEEAAKRIGQSFIPQEIENIKGRLSEIGQKAVTAVGAPVAKRISEYQAEKQTLKAKAIANTVRYNSMNPDKPLSEEDHELMLDMLGVDEGTPLMKTASTLSAVNHAVAKFKSGVIDPLKHAVQGFNRAMSTPQRQFLRDHAPQLAILGETFAYPAIGETEWGLGEKGAEKDPTTLDPVAQKLINDKASIIGSDAGAAMLSLATGYRDLPLWLIGGSTKLGMMLGGMATEAAKEDGNLIKGGAEGVIAGTAMTKLMKLKPVQKVLEAGLETAFKAKELAAGRGLLDKNWNFYSRNVEPLALMSTETVNKLADNVLNKLNSNTTDLMKTQVIKPQAVVLDWGESGAKLYGVHNGEYGELPSNWKNSDKRPVIITTNAKKNWVENYDLLEAYERLTVFSNPSNKSHSIDEWSKDILPPENDPLMFAWKQVEDGAPFMEVYRAGSDDFNADLLRARNLVVVEYGPDADNPLTGLGYLNTAGVVIAPDPAENIPNAIPNDLVFVRRGLNLTNLPDRVNPENVMAGDRTYVPRSQEPDGVANENQAWAIRPIVDQRNLYRIIDHIKGVEAVRIEGDFENLRGSRFPDGINIIQEPAPFDNLPNAMPEPVGPATEPEPLNFGFLPNAMQAAIAKALTQNPVSKYAFKHLLPTTSYGEAFKVDAAGVMFSLRHFKRYAPDLKKHFELVFGTPQMTDIQRVRLSDDIIKFVEGKRNTPPAVLAPQIQAKVNTFVNERNMDYALISQLGGSVPVTKKDNLYESLEQLYARDYMTAEQWANRLSKVRSVTDVEKTLLSLNKGSPIGKIARESEPALFGRQNIETELANDYMNRKMQLTTLTVMKELAEDPKASSSAYNTALGHTRRVDFMESGLLNGKYVSPETYDAIYTFPMEQKAVRNMMVRMIDRIKYNKTVLNPIVWGKNIMGNVWGVMNSNIVPVWQLTGANKGTMVDRMALGLNTMRKDLNAYNVNLMDNSNPAVQRVHESLKFGLLGAHFESNKGSLLEVVDNLREGSGNKSWGERLQNLYFKGKDNTLGKLGDWYSMVDSATKYSLYVNGLKRWGIDLNTNKLDPAYGRFHAGKLLGYDTIANMANDEVTESVKRAVVRRIYLSLPMVDRTAPLVNKLAQTSGLTNPWMRTAFELARITAQMPWRSLNEPGYAVNMLKTAGLLGGLYMLNRHIRRENGISDEEVDMAWKVAPENAKQYMPGGMATWFRASDGGIVFIDAGDQLVESLQWFGGDEKTAAPQRVLTNLLQTVYGGGVIDNEARFLLSGIGLAKEPSNYQKPFWKQQDWQRTTIDLLTKFGPAIVNNGMQYYATSHMPKSKALGMDKPEQPRDIQMARMLGLDVMSFGTKDQGRMKRKQLMMRKKELYDQLGGVARQREGSSTGLFQEPFNKEKNRDKIREEIKRIDAEIASLPH